LAITVNVFFGRKFQKTGDSGWPIEDPAMLGKAEFPEPNELFSP
jgi:hypothetical protein